MEDTLRGLPETVELKKASVLILVLMEDTLRDVERVVEEELELCLNPCFNGRYSQSKENRKSIISEYCLNPCFNGRYSQSVKVIRTPDWRGS